MVVDLLLHVYKVRRLCSYTALKSSKLGHCRWAVGLPSSLYNDSAVNSNSINECRNGLFNTT